ncbi:MAG: ornithine--oxo-acid transaminase [Legionellales bacterium]|nr:ornithine--oxo-acid transaminase [Legionellales bacterium]
MNSPTNDQDYIALEQQYGANNYHPLPVVLIRGEGIYVWDVHGKQYIDMMSAYSAVSHGHCHPRLVKILIHQAKQLNLTSRAYYTDKLGAFLKKACELFQMDKALPMNTGAEAVETALKAIRKWAYTVKQVPKNQAEIIVCRGNFHGRTIGIISFTSEQQYRQGFGPFAPGFKIIPYGDVSALAQAITPNTAAFLVEPIQGEGGIVLPPSGYLAQCAAICRDNNVLLVTDEVQTGLGRTGKLLASYHDDVQPDALILGKALGGGILPISLFLARDDVMNVFQPGDHGSTFGGNPLAASIGLEALNIIEQDQLAERAEQLGHYFQQQLLNMHSPLIKEIRGQGLLIGIEIDPQHACARHLCKQLLHLGLLSKETHQTVIRLAPPLIITKQQIDDAVSILQQVLINHSQSPPKTLPK